MNALEIRMSLREKGFYLADIARGVGVSRSMICKVVDGSAKSRHVAESVARLLGKTVDELWPGLYPEDYVMARREQASLKADLVKAVLQAHSASERDES
jgi:lambda repressor-like predicted transcriptional regulator